MKTHLNKTTAWVLAGFGLIALAGCSSPAGSGGGAPGLFAGNSGPENNDPSGTYSVLLHVFNTPERHMQEAQIYKKSLEETQKWRGLRVVSQADHSELYWGRFRTVDDAKPTLKRAKDYRTTNGATLFAQAIVVALPGTQVGPAEWDLRNAPGTYSLLVAVFENDPQSKPPYVQCARDAVDYCTQLRQEGHEAYYHHGPNKSSVTIGSFGPEAARVEEKQAFQFGQSNPVTVQNLVLTDPKLLALQRKFPRLAYNGRELINVRRDRQGKVVARTVSETYVVKIPKEGEPSAADNRIGNR